MKYIYANFYFKMDDIIRSSKFVEAISWNTLLFISEIETKLRYKLDLAQSYTEQLDLEVLGVSLLFSLTMIIEGTSAILNDLSSLREQETGHFCQANTPN